jgi:hypothetical protein
MKHSEQLWKPSSYLFNGYWGSFPRGNTVDHHSNHSPSFLHLWTCGAQPLLIPLLCDMVSNLWSLMSGVSIMQCHTQTLNIRLRWLHFMAFLMQISFQFWSSVAFTGHLVQATNSYAQGKLYLYLTFFVLLIFKQLHWLGWSSTIMHTLVQDVSVLLWPIFYPGSCFFHFLCSKHTTLLTCFLSRSRVTTFSLQYCRTFWKCLWYAGILQGIMAITYGTRLCCCTV